MGAGWALRMKTRVLIAESHHLLRARLRSLIGALPDFEVVGDCEDGEQALRLALELSPALVLMDLCLPALSGIEATAQIKRCAPQVRVAILAADKAAEYVRAALRAGVDGYVLQDASYDELVTALRSIVGGNKFVSPEASEHLTGGAADETLPKKSLWDQLTERERSVWKLIAEGCTNRTTAELLAISPKTVEKHRANLRRKLGLRNAAELTLAAKGHGLIPHADSAAPLPSGAVPQARGDAPSANASS